MQILIPFQWSFCFLVYILLLYWKNIQNECVIVCDFQQHKKNFTVVKL